MHRVERLDWQCAQQRVYGEMRRFRDGFTRDALDDIAQDVSFAMWRFSERHRNEGPMYKALRVIVQRQRWTAIRKASRVADCENVRKQSQDGFLQAEDACLRVDGVLVPVDWLLEQLRSELSRLCQESRAALLAFHEGMNCKQIAEQLGSTESAIKARLCRGREHLKKRIEDRVRVAGCFEA